MTVRTALHSHVINVRLIQKRKVNERMLKTLRARSVFLLSTPKISLRVSERGKKKMDVLILRRCFSTRLVLPETSFLPVKSLRSMWYLERQVISPRRGSLIEGVFFLWNFVYFGSRDAKTTQKPKVLRMTWNFHAFFGTGEADVQTKSETILTGFERFRELWNFRICRRFSRVYCSIIYGTVLIFRLESQNLNAI